MDQDEPFVEIIIRISVARAVFVNKVVAFIDYATLRFCPFSA